MRVLVTGHAGYIGTVLVPLLRKAGHELTGLDSNLFERCTFGEGIEEIPSLSKDMREVDATRPRRLRCGAASGRLVERSAGRS